MTAPSEERLDGHCVTRPVNGCLQLADTSGDFMAVQLLVPEVVRDIFMCGRGWEQFAQNRMV